MWKFEQIARSSTDKLLLETERSPQTLYEIHQLAELARRVVRGEAPLQELIRRVVASCSDREILFGAPPGYLAAEVLATAPDPVCAAFWLAASQGLDARSFAALRRQLQNISSPPQLPVDLDKDTMGDHEHWMVTVYGPAEEAAVVTAVRSVVSGASLVDSGTDFEPLVWVFEMSSGADVRVAMSTASVVASATGAPSSCDIPAALGPLGPDIVAFCRPGGEPALGAVQGDTDDSLTFTPMDST